MIITEGMQKINPLKAISLLFLVNMLRLTMSLKTDAPIAQGIEHRPPEAGAAVRIRLGVFLHVQK